MSELGFIKKFSRISDPRGSLLPIELEKEFGFKAERIYFLYDSVEPRGFHAHKNLQQIMVAIRGSCTVLLDDGRNRQEFYLNSNREALFVNKLLWREIYNFSADCFLLVAASHSYSEDDYLRDYEKFLQYVSAESQNKQ